MSKKLAKNDWRDAALALSLAAGGGLLILLAVKTLSSGGLPESDKPLAVLARAMIGNFGLVPGLLAGLAMAGAGTWMFLTERYEGVVRHLLGALCTVAGLAVLLGALSPEAGGRFGAFFGGGASSILTTGGGAVFGVIVLLAPVWLFWFRERVDFASMLKSAPRSTADSDAGDTGVSVAEAEALAPVMVSTASAGKPAPELSNPYPEDVRLKGALPAGTTPLDAHGQVLTADAPDDLSDSFADSTYDSSVHRWTPARHEPADESADEDLAAAGTVAPDDLDDFDDELGEVRPFEPVGDAADPFAEHRYAVADEEEEDEEELVEEAALEDETIVAVSTNGAVKLPESYQPPRPSWETDLDEEDVIEPVPVAVAEALEELTAEDLEEELATVYAEDEDDDEYVLDDEDDDEDDEDDDDSYDDDDDEEEDDDEIDVDDDDDYSEATEELEDELEVTHAALASEDEDEGEDEDEEEYEEEEDELEETLAEDDSESEEEEAEYEEEEEELEETFAEDDSESDEDEEEYEEEEDEEDAEELEEAYAADASEADEEDEEEYEEEDEEEFEETLAEDDSELDEDDSAPLELETAAAAAGEVQMDLFDDPKPAKSSKPAPARSAAPARDSGENEPEVVLEPQAAAGDGARKVSAQMLTDAGNLFLQENRVAVSMLQKRFALDFGESCVILDELQELGLIGPFVDGAPRDILMSSEAWLELTGQA